MGTMVVPYRVLPGGVMDRKVIKCNYIASTKSVGAWSSAYLIRTNPGSGDERIVVLARSRSGRLIQKWEKTTRLGNFRVKTLPPSHPRFNDERIWNYDPEYDSELIDRLNRISK